MDPKLVQIVQLIQHDVGFKACSTNGKSVTLHPFLNTSLGLIFPQTQVLIFSHSFLSLTVAPRERWGNAGGQRDRERGGVTQGGGESRASDLSTLTALHSSPGPVSVLAPDVTVCPSVWKTQSVILSPEE